MLVGALRSDNPLGGAPLTCDDATEAFSLQGIGEISAVKLLDLENRRQLVWSDLVTREWVLETAAIRVRRETAAKAAAAVAAAAAAAVAATTASTAAENDQSDTGNIPVDGGAHGSTGAPGGHTLVFGPPGTAGAAGSSGLATLPNASAPALQPPVARRPAGVPAATTRFAALVDDGRVAGRLVWSETVPEVAALEHGLALAVQGDGRKGSAPAAAWTPPPGPPAWPWQVGEHGQAIVTRRADRRRSLQKTERRRRLSAASGRAVVVALFAVAMVVLVLVAQHGGF